jgi:hypothetical protein
MKFLAATFAFACLSASVASAASTAPGEPPPQPPLGLRQAVQQYDAGSGAAPRRLTAGERAELRRQLSEPVPPPPRPSKPYKQRKDP